MLFNSIEFLIFFPIVVLVYYLVPAKYRYIWVMISSYYFYLSWNMLYGLLLLGITAITYLAGLIIDKNEANGKWGKAVIFAVVLISLSLLAVFKYSNFITMNIQKVLQIVHINYSLPTFSILLPVGISFYLFQSLGYVIDVYRKKVKAERNFILYAAFISFFPQLVAGPIERAGNLLPQFYEEHRFDYKRVKSNLLLMLWGLFMKMVIADRISIFVDCVYDNVDNDVYRGWLVLMATILFAFQIYCDFAGYTTIAIGAAGVMGFSLMENFRSPYCADGIRDFWGRWHISLTGWFRDYVYIPLGGNRKGKVRKQINTVIVFLLSGLWHGANWSYVCWGVMNGLLIVLEDITTGIRNKLCSLLRINREFVLFRIIRTAITFILVDITWIFFRAEGTPKALFIIKQMMKLDNTNVFFDNTIHFYVMQKNVVFMMLFSILILIIVDVLHNLKISIREVVERRNIVIRWTLYLGLIMSILIFGVWGPAFNEQAFIYFQF